jgi:octaprenyl-diphosphate synthase
MRNGNASEATLIKLAIEHGGLDDLPAVLSAVERTGALQHVRRIAEHECELACAEIAHFADSPHKQAMLILAQFSVSRNY